MTKTFFKGAWDCDACHTTGHGPDDLICPNCKAVRSKNAKTYLPTDRQVVTDPVELSRAKSGANWICNHCDTDNWICNHCDTDNWNSNSSCKHCGAARGSSPSRSKHKYTEASVPRSGSEAPFFGSTSVFSSAAPNDTRYSVTSDEPEDSQLYTSSAQPSFSGRSRSRSFRISPLAILAALILFVAGVVFFLTRTHEVTAKINGFSWTRTIYVETYRTVREGAWSIPGGGRYVSEESKIHHYDTVFDHYETVQRSREVSDGTESYQCGTTITDEGNGYFSSEPEYCERQKTRTEYYTEQEAVYRQEPRYETWYTYDIDKWVYSRNVPTQGASRNDPEPNWGELGLSLAGQTAIGAEREARREEHYYLSFLYESDKPAYVREVPYGDWTAYDPAQDYILVMNNLGAVNNDPLRPDK